MTRALALASLLVTLAGCGGCGLPETELHVMNIDGSGDRVITTGTLAVEPRWSVDDKLVFMKQTDGALNVFTIGVDGKDLQQLTHDGGNNGDPTWSPDGNTITFGSDREGDNKLDVFAMNADGSGQHAITKFAPPVEGGDTNWSSDGTQIVFEHDIGGNKQSDPTAPAEVWIMNADGTAPTSTTQKCSDAGCAPRFNPIDAHTIAYVFNDPTKENPAGVNHVYVMTLDDNGAVASTHRLTQGTETENNPWWSPDGKSIVFVRDLDGAALYRVDVDGTNLTRLSPAHARDIFPVFSPDGTRVAFARLLSAPP